MFQVTWSHFLFVCIVIIGLYYAIAVLLLYSSEIIAFAKSGFRKSPPTNSEPLHQEVTVMGETRTNDMALIEERVGQVREPLVVADDDELPEMIQPAGASKQNFLRELADGLIVEANTVVQLAIDLQSDEAETSSLFNALFIRYPEIATSSFRASVNQAISESINGRLTFRVTVAQVDQWWEE